MRNTSESGMVSVETALSIGPLLAVMMMALMPLMGWVYVIDAGHNAREIAREYALHGERGATELIAYVQAQGNNVQIKRAGQYADITVIKPLPSIMQWLGINVSGSHRVMVEP